MTERFHGSPPSQFDGGALERQNCVPASLAAAAEEASNGRITLSASAVRAKVRNAEETNPRTAGWSLWDADLAAQRIGINLYLGDPTTGIRGVLEASNEGRVVLIQGDSEVFPDNLSGNFDGNHCVAICPRIHSDGRRLLGEPILGVWRWETVAQIQKYAEAFAGRGRANFAYTDPVPLLTPLPPLEEDPMPKLLIVSRQPATVDVRVDAQLYLPDLTPKVKVTKVNDAYSPFTTAVDGVKYRALYISTGGELQLLLAREADCFDVRPYVDPAVSRLKAVKAKIAAVAADVAND